MSLVASGRVFLTAAPQRRPRARRELGGAAIRWIALLLNLTLWAFLWGGARMLLG